MEETLEGVRHRRVAVNGISMHVAEKGEEGPLVLLLHGFPELWYSWRHQIGELAARGYRAVAPDLRGFGDTDAPPEPSSYTILHVVGDVVALLRALGESEVIVVGHDWGAIVGWTLATFRPDMVKAVMGLSFPFRPRHPSLRPVAALRAACGDDYYVVKFQKPGAAESEFAGAGCSKTLRRMLSFRLPAGAPPGGADADPSGEEGRLPPWLTEADIQYYASKYERSGFTGGLNYYRNLDANWELTAPWTGVQLQVPAKFVIGDVDLVYHMPGMKEYIHGRDGLRRDVPQLQDVVVVEGAGHFITQERPCEITDHILDFVRRFP